MTQDEGDVEVLGALPISVARDLYLGPEEVVSRRGASVDGGRT